MPRNVPVPSQVYVRCSDPNVICSSDIVQHGEPHDVVFKVHHWVVFDGILHSKMQYLSPSVA